MNKILRLVALATSLSGLLLGANAAQGQIKVQDGLQIYYPLDGNTTDFSGMHNDGTAIDVLYMADRNGTASKAGMFNGSTSVLSSAFAANILQNFSIAVWMKPTAFGLTGQLLSAAGAEDFNIFCNIGISGDSIGFAFQAGGVRQPQLAYRVPTFLNRWFHLCAVRSGTSEKLFLNGGLVDSGRVSNDVLDGTSSNWLVGGSLTLRQAGFGGFFTGGLDDFRVYNRSLTKAEVDTLADHLPSHTSMQKEAQLPRLQCENGHYNIYNPAHAKLDIRIMTYTGQVLQTIQTSEGECSLTGLTHGLNLVWVQAGGQSRTYKIVKPD